MMQMLTNKDTEIKMKKMNINGSDGLMLSNPKTRKQQNMMDIQPRKEKEKFKLRTIERFFRQKV